MRIKKEPPVWRLFFISVNVTIEVRSAVAG